MDISVMVFFLVILVLSVILHEVAHGYVALAQGDTTARDAGRLTLNPIPHIDPIGSVAVPLLLVVFQSPILFGWAKPVPVNPYNLRDKKYGSAKVSFAGPGANLAIALFFGLLLRFASMPIADVLPGLIPLFIGIVQVNLFLAIFNLVPIPPLDGSHILFDFLPRSLISVRRFLEQYGVFVLIFFIFFLFRFLEIPFEFLFRLIVGF
jgi:Zn-dependent protease